jgi:hypothetical protein
MPLPVIANVIRCSAEGTLSNGHEWANVFHLRKSGALSYAAAIAVADPVIAAFYTNHLAGSPGLSYYMYTSADVDRIRYTPLDGTSATTVVAHNQAGTNGSDPLPPQTALCVTLYTALRGRAHRGRFYLPALTEGSNGTGGTVAAGTISDLSAQFTAAFITNLVGTGVSLVVASYLAPGSAENVVSILINNTWDTQRRRARP